MLTYDDTLHLYRIDGRIIPSVTQALKIAGHIDTRFYSLEAAARGSAVHALCQYLDDGTVPVPHGRIVDLIAERGDELQGYYEAYESFLFDTRVTYSGVEVLCAHPSGDYGGRPDRLVANLFGEQGVLELKTGDEEDWHAYQLALYQLMRPSGSRWAVYLGKNGRYRGPVRMTNADDYRIGRNAIAQAWAALTSGARL